MFRTRFAHDIVAEFLPPKRQRKRHELILLCDGMPSIPRKQSLAAFLAEKGYWVIYPRYRGAWESGGSFLEKSPHQDLLDVLDSLPGVLEDIAFGERFALRPERVFIIGGSFGGAAALLAARDSRVTKVLANCAVVDWSILDRAELAETSRESYPSYIREAFGNAYRLRERNWNKLRGGRFYSPWHHRAEIDGGKVMMIHAKDDPHVPYETAKAFAGATGARLKTLRTGGHISTDFVTRRYWAEIQRFFGR